METTISQIRAQLEQGIFRNEQSISQGIVLRILSQLGWDAFDTQVVCPEYSLGPRRVDFALCCHPNQPTVFVECKQPGKTENADRQLFEYAFHAGVPLAVLTDGQTWSFYLPAEQGNYEDRRVYKLDLLERSIEDSAKSFRQYLDFNRIKSGEALDEARLEYKNRNRKRIQLGYSYDAYRRLDKIWAPQNRQIQNHYNSRGVLTKVTGLDNGSFDHTWWEATDYDAQNRITDFKLAGGNMLGERKFKGGSGLISDVQTGTSPSTSNIYRFRYSYDKLGNVTNRQQTAPYSLSESFTYDALNRLKTWDPSTQPLVSANYNTIGNITSRSDVNGGSTWAYDANRPHAVTTAGSNSYSYDANGRMSTRNGSSVWWLPFNKPRAIFSASNSYTFYYDNNRNRVLETVIQNGTQRSIVKYGSLYEEVADNGVDTYRLFIPTPMGVVGVWNRGDLGDQKRYHHKDLLGSVGLETNENGTVQNQYAYDPWGAPRTPSTWASLSTWPDYGSDRGYTSHEMLEGLELVHMNGRIYDPAIGRFLTPDPFVQFSGDSQSYNRYSYVLNNPLRYTDPSGHFVFVLGMGAYWASAGVTTQTFGYFVASMFAAGFIDTFMMSGGDVDQALQAGAFTAAASVVTFGIGTAFESPTGGLLGALEDKPTLLALAQHTAHGISSGAFTELAGGDFGAGFAAGMAGSFGGSVAQSRGGLQGFLIAAIAGGTAAELGGGKFANGAVTGAMVYLLSRAAIKYPHHHYANLENGNVRLSYGGAGSGVYAEGTRAEMEALAVSLDKLYAVPSTRSEIDALIVTPRDTPLIVLSTTGTTADVGSGTSVSTGQIYWHPTRTGRYNSPAFVTLGHEIHHAYEFITGTIQGFSNYTGVNPPWEMGALKAENRIRAFYGIRQKQNYSITPFRYAPGMHPPERQPFELKPFIVR